MCTYIYIYTHIYIYTCIQKFAGPTAQGVSDLKYGLSGSRVVYGIPGLRVEQLCILYFPPTPQRASGAPKCEAQCMAWGPGRSIFRFLGGFDFGLDVWLVLGPFWARLGLLLMGFWEPKSGRVRPKMHLESSCCQKCRSSKNSGKRKVLATFLISGWSLDRLKTGPRRVQER